MNTPVCFGKSRWPALLLLLWLSCQLSVSWYWPASWPAGFSLLACIGQALLSYTLWLQCRQTPGWIVTTTDGRCQLGHRWERHSSEYQSHEQQMKGRWLADCRWCWAGFWLCWQDDQQQRHSRWLFADAFSDDARRALARQLRECQRKAAGSTIALV